MTNLIEYHIPEAIQIRVTKAISNNVSTASLSNELPLIEVGQDVVSCTNNVNICNFCVDPQLTSFSILQSLVVRAFNLQW